MTVTPPNLSTGNTVSNLVVNVSKDEWVDIKRVVDAYPKSILPLSVKMVREMVKDKSRLMSFKGKKLLKNQDDRPYMLL